MDELESQSCPGKLGPRIALFLPTLNIGGAERTMLTLANAFAQRGLSVDLVLVDACGPFLEQLSASVRVIDLGTGRMAFALGPLVRYFRRERPDAMLSALGHANVVAVWARWLSRTDVRLVVSERSTFSSAWQGMAGRSATAWILPWLVRLSYKKADKIVSVSYGVESDLKRYVGFDPKKSLVIYNPVVGDDLQALARESLDSPWLADGEPAVLLAVGRLTSAKNYPLLLSAFARVRAKRRCRLVILGDGELRGSLAQQVQSLGIVDDVAMPGFVVNPFPWMRRAKVFVLSSSWEGLPGALIQAMACGTAVVSTDCPSGPAEILEDGRWGRLVPVGDAQMLASAIESVLDDPCPPDVKARAAFFSVERSVNAYLNALSIPTTCSKTDD